MLIISSLVVEIEGRNKMHSQASTLRCEVVFLLLDFALVCLVHGHKLNFLLEENSFCPPRPNSVTWNWQTTSKQGCCAHTESKQVVLLTSWTFV